MKKPKRKLPRWIRILRLYANDFFNLFFPIYHGDGSDLNEWDKWLNGYNDKDTALSKKRKVSKKSHAKKSLD